MFPIEAFPLLSLSLWRAKRYEFFEPNFLTAWSNQIHMDLQEAAEDIIDQVEGEINADETM